MTNNDFYRKFEDKYRGSRDLIKERLTVYLPFVRPLKDLYPEATALDIGCGRGEWLELLQAQGIQAQGIDLDEGMLQACQQRNLNVLQGNGIDYLTQQQSESHSLITAFHVVEHIPFEALQTLIEQAQRVLKPGGILILETPNPENIKVATENFYLDPTHIKPIPASMLAFMPEFYGFARTKTLRLQENKALMDEKQMTLKTVYEGASPDYAIVAQKKAIPDIHQPFDQAFDQSYGLSLATLIEQFDKRLFFIEHLATKAQEQVVQVQEQAQAQIARSRAQTEQALHHLHLVLNSRSWQLTKPLRELASFSRWFTTGATHWITFSPTSRPRRILNNLLLKLKHTLNAHPKVKSLIIKALNQTPVLKHKLKTVTSEPTLQLYQSDQYFHQPHPTQQPALKTRSLQQRDRHLSPQQIEQHLHTLIIEGHFSGSYSLAAINRNIVYKLKQSPYKLHTYISPREGQVTDTLHAIPEGKAHLKLLKASLTPKELKSPQVIRLYHHYPVVEQTDKDNAIPILLFFWEESKIPIYIIHTINNAYHGVIVTSWFVKKTLQDNGCTRPIHIITPPLANPNHSHSTAQDLTRYQPQTPIKILHISSCFPRKGIDTLLQSFNQLCQQGTQVQLTIKTFHNPHNQVQQLIKEIVAPQYHPQITLIFDEYDHQQMSQLYRQADIIVLPTRGEGLNMPAIEAVAHQRPLIVTGYGAHMDYLDPNTHFIEYRFEPSCSHLAAPQSVWATASVQHLTQSLKQSIETLTTQQTHQHLQIQQQNLSALLFTDNAVASLLSGLARLAHTQPKPAPLKFTIVTTWQTPCGIAEYSKYIVNQLAQHAAHIQILHTIATQATDAPSKTLTQTPVFTEGQPLNLTQTLISGDIIWLQHHFAFYPLNHALQQQIQTLQHQGKDCYITLHTTKPLLKFPPAAQNESRHLLNTFDRVFVHTLEDLNILKTLGILHNVTLMPQGIDPQTPPESQPISKQTYTLGTFGFLYPHKGIQKLITAFARLIKCNPEQAYKLHLITAVKQEPTSHSEHQACQQLIQKLQLADHIEWHTQFLPDQEVKTQLSQIDLLVLPYQYTEESSSAAVRMALSVCPNVAVTPAPIFNEVRQACFPIKGFEIEDIYTFLQQHTQHPDTKQAQQIHQQRQQWIERNSWKNIVENYILLFQSIAADKKFL